MNNLWPNIRKFVTGTIEELGKCSWPKREELYRTTIIVIVAIASLAVFVSVVDFVSQRIIRILTGF
ncbi:MAG TPA: preprotein translocase subunit SecE [Lentisphaeria bacterium]|nr:MAG: preprotein translocase subunit SecE [Lentisphaerae bacterium GWF2_38_69]HBM15472.1 preprotein translocase subunit SecE [Lentisphaeria bacterium]